MSDPPRRGLERSLGHSFRKPLLLEEALTHSSFVNEHPGEAPSGDNERLEFLGDAVLGLVVGEWLFREHPEMDEGQLSRARASLVSAANLRTRAEHLALGRYLRIGSGEEKTGGREKPRLLAGALEAVIGAMYLDAGANLTRQVVVALLGDQLSEAGGAVAGAFDFKSVLQERLQADGQAVPEYRVVGEAGPDHLKTFRVRAVAGNAVLSDGEGPTRKAAEQAAARESLRMLDAGGDPPGSEAG